jgi:hypothetical protein
LTRQLNKPKVRTTEQARIVPQECGVEATHEIEDGDVTVVILLRYSVSLFGGCAWRCVIKSDTRATLVQVSTMRGIDATLKGA